MRIQCWKTPEQPEGYALKLDGDLYRDLFKLIYYGPRIAELCFPNPSDFTRLKDPVRGVTPIRREDLAFKILKPDRLPMRLKTDLASWSYYYKIIRHGEEVDAILKEFFTSEYKVAIFKIRTEKRSGHTRDIALPVDSEFEPWTHDLMKRFEEGHPAPKKLIEKYPGDSFVFPFTRGMAFHVAHQTFKGFGYKIKNREESKPYGNHANRHITESRMQRDYGFTDFDTEALLGHTHKSRSEMHDVYGNIEAWEMYFPKIILTKMLKRRL